MSPGWGSGRLPGGRYWTDERVTAALRAYVARTSGPLPSQCDAFNAITAGDPTLPISQRIIKQFGAMARAWPAVGAPRERCPILGCAWTEEEIDYLLSHAGEQTLAQVGRHLHRTSAACKRKLYDLGTRARDAQGFMSALQVAAEHHVPHAHVLQMIYAGELRAHRPAGKPNIWAIDPEDAAAAAALLRTWTRAPLSGQYRSLVDRNFGGVIAVPAGEDAHLVRQRLYAAARYVDVLISTRWEDDTMRRLAWRRVGRRRAGRPRRQHLPVRTGLGP